MNEKSIKEVVGLVCEARQPGECVGIEICGDEGLKLEITRASSRVLDAITDNGYYVSVGHRSVVVSAEEG